MQVNPSRDPADELDRMIRAAVPGRRGLDAWTALLRAHAGLVRQLETDLYRDVGMTLGDFDVLAQLAQAGGELRMSELAERAFSSRSGMTRRVARLVEEGLLRRAGSDADGRGVVVTITAAGLARLGQAVPAHLKRVLELFVNPLGDDELASVQAALGKVMVDCEFG